MAVTEILEALDGCGDKLQEAREAAGVGEEVEAKLDEVSIELTTVMNALQFQDITSQPIEATHAGLGQRPTRKLLGMRVRGAAKGLDDRLALF